MTNIRKYKRNIANRNAKKSVIRTKARCVKLCVKLVCSSIRGECIQRGFDFNRNFIKFHNEYQILENKLYSIYA